MEQPEHLRRKWHGLETHGNRKAIRDRREDSVPPGHADLRRTLGELLWVSAMPAHTTRGASFTLAALDLLLSRADGLWIVMISSTHISEIAILTHPYAS
jgi:hypothetical protein